jgi:hypothetical protein
MCRFHANRIERILIKHLHKTPSWLRWPQAAETNSYCVAQPRTFHNAATAAVRPKVYTNRVQFMFRRSFPQKTAHRNKNCIGNKTFIALNAVNSVPGVIRNSVIAEPVNFNVSLRNIAVKWLTSNFVNGRSWVLIAARKHLILTVVHNHSREILGGFLKTYPDIHLKSSSRNTLHFDADTTKHGVEFQSGM